MCTLHQHAAPKLSHSLQVVLLVAYESLALEWFLHSVS